MVQDVLQLPARRRVASRRRLPRPPPRARGAHAVLVPAQPRACRRRPRPPPERDAPRNGTLAPPDGAVVPGHWIRWRHRALAPRGRVRRAIDIRAATTHSASKESARKGWACRFRPTNYPEMAGLRHRVILEPEDEGGYNVVIPAFPNGQTSGDTIAQCLANAREVIELEIAYFEHNDTDWQIGARV